MSEHHHNAAPAGRFNPRFVAFARSIGKTPSALFNEGKFGAEFMAFTRQELTAFCATLGRNEARLTCEADHEAFTGYLLAKYPEPVVTEGC